MSDKVTPAMATAGARAVQAFSLTDLAEGWTSPHEVALAVYAAMEEERERDRQNR